ncbi:hypothetical protein PoB_000079500 [Plakobranchus ocellatus]|uniref:Uncharacterized protein n=1 Tax=Plakobranchus ocellatus TaxID=259542 RepID=A0AAV3XV70_9GAST|nr:hypothetical protein PoB_000079500 [Plakobranchus ocellatus]
MSNKAYKIVKELTGTKQTRITTIENKEGKCLTEEKEILERWTEYCSELYTHVATNEDPNVLNVPPSSNNARHGILRAEIIELRSCLIPETWKISRNRQHHRRNGSSWRGSDYRHVTPHL